MTCRRRSLIWLALRPGHPFLAARCQACGSIRRNERIGPSATRSSRSFRVPIPVIQTMVDRPLDRGPLVSLAAGDLVYIHNEGDGTEELYNERDDPRELTNRAASDSMRPVLERFRQQLARLKAQPDGGRNNCTIDRHGNTQLVRFLLSHLARTPGGLSVAPSPWPQYPTAVLASSLLLISTARREHGTH